MSIFIHKVSVKARSHGAILVAASRSCDYSLFAAKEWSHVAIKFLRSRCYLTSVYKADETSVTALLKVCTCSHAEESTYLTASYKPSITISMS